MKEQQPTIKLSREFKEWLEIQGNKGESYEDVIKRLIKRKEVKK